MRLTTIVAIGIGFSATAQDWALLNPAHKYNYSVDGTDTITNQVFVTGIDTLGANDHLFTLSRVATICDTCGGSWSVFVWPDAPQWLGGTVRITNDVWHFSGNGSCVILPSAAEGSTWLYDTLNGVWAEMGATIAATTFGMPDEHRTISLSSGGGLLLSRDHGVLNWASGHVLIGINGPQLGRTIPTLTEFFPYGNGDVLEYEKWHGYCDGIGGCEGWSSEYKFTVDAGTMADSAVHFSGWMTAHDLWYFQLGGIGSPTQYVHSYPNHASVWKAGIPELPWAELLLSHPGQLVQRHHFMDPNSAPNFCIAEHGLDSVGRYVIGCRAFAQGSSGEVGHFFIQGQSGPFGTVELPGPFDMAIPGDLHTGVTYAEGLGLIAFTGNYFERGEHYLLRGLMLNGDTVYGSITDDGILLGTADLQVTDPFVIGPNPANAHITVDGLPPGTDALLVRDATGRTHLSIPVRNMDRSTIDVCDLPNGIYLLCASPGNLTQRFVVAR
jgi:hypothetical protein